MTNGLKRCVGTKLVSFEKFWTWMVLAQILEEVSGIYPNIYIYIYIYIYILTLASQNHPKPHTRILNENAEYDNERKENTS